MDCSEIIFFGRLEERKGLPEFVEALIHLTRSDGPVFRVTFVGKVVPLYAAPNRGMDSEAFIKSKLHGKVEFSILPDLGSRGAIDFVCKSEGAVVCLTSPSDNFPNAALEMGQIARPLVVSDTIGFHQTLGLIGRTEAVHWFAPGCPYSLAKALRKALENNGSSPRVPSAGDIERLNEQLLQERLNMLDSVFAAKRKEHQSKAARIKTAVVLAPASCRMRDLRRSLLALAAADGSPETIVLVSPGLNDGDLHRLKTRFPGLTVVRESASTLQQIIAPHPGSSKAEDYALVLIAGAGPMKKALTNLAFAALRHPALIVAAEAVFGRHPRISSFVPPSASMLVRENNSCGSWLAVSTFFVQSLPPLQLGRPAFALWLLVLAASVKGESISYLPLPQYSVRPTSLAATLHSRSPNDEELSLIWHYLAKIEAGSWSRRELRSLVLSVQQLAFSEASARQAESSLRNVNAELCATNDSWQKAHAELQFTTAELHKAQAGLRAAQAELNTLYASSSWKITKPLRLAAKWLRGNGGR